MAKITAVILAKALKQGKHKVRIAIAHNSETRYIATDIILDSDKEFKNGLIIKRGDASSKNTKLRKLILQYQEAIDAIISIECLTCSELIDIIQKIGNRKGRTLSSVFEEYIEYTNLKPGSVQCYKRDFNSISTFIGTEFPVAQITHRTMIGLDAWLTTEEIKTIKNIPIKKKNISKCRDIFMLSYYLGGINVIDLFKIDFNKTPKALRYIRTKTEKQSR